MKPYANVLSEYVIYMAENMEFILKTNKNMQHPYQV